MSESLVDVLQEPWATLTEQVLAMAAPPKTWFIDASETDTLLFIGPSLAPIRFRSLSQASAVQGMLAYAKLSWDREQSN